MSRRVAGQVYDDFAHIVTALAKSKEQEAAATAERTRMDAAMRADVERIAELTAQIEHLTGGGRVVTRDAYNALEARAERAERERDEAKRLVERAARYLDILSALGCFTKSQQAFHEVHGPTEEAANLRRAASIASPQPDASAKETGS